MQALSQKFVSCIEATPSRYVHHSHTQLAALFASQFSIGVAALRDMCLKEWRDFTREVRAADVSGVRGALR